jgi:hypothetical protein
MAGSLMPCYPSRRCSANLRRTAPPAPAECPSRPATRCRASPRRHKHDPRPPHLLRRQLLRPSGPLKHPPLVPAELDPVPRRPCHRHHNFAPRPQLLHPASAETSGRVYFAAFHDRASSVWTSVVLTVYWRERVSSDSLIATPSPGCQASRPVRTRMPESRVGAGLSPAPTRLAGVFSSRWGSRSRPPLRCRHGTGRSSP